LIKLKQKRRIRKKDHSGLLGLVILVVVFVGIAFLITSPPSGSHASVKPSGGEDAFYGSITNVPFKGQMDGIVKADTNCKPVENGLTNCIAIIDAGGTELDFNYKHFMDMGSEGQACLASGDHVTMTLQSDGTVKLIRG
jgi:hypothetical protein